MYSGPGCMVRVYIAFVYVVRIVSLPVTEIASAHCPTPGFMQRLTVLSVRDSQWYLPSPFTVS